MILDNIHIDTNSVKNKIVSERVEKYKFISRYNISNAFYVIGQMD